MFVRKAITIITFSIVFWMCSKQEEVIVEIQEGFGTPPVVNRMSSEDFVSQSEVMFEDGEDIEKIVSPNRAFSVQKPFYAQVKEGKLRVFNAMAHNFKEVSLWLIMPEMRDTLLLMQFEEIHGFHDLQIDSPLKMGEVIHSSKSGKPIRTNNLALLSPDLYNLELTCKDSIFDMLKTIKMKTIVQLGKYGNGNWGLMTPNAARYYVTSAVNMAVMFSSDIFRDSLLNFKGSIHADNGKEIDREALLKAMLNKSNLMFGVVTGPGIAGLGGGIYLGLREEYLGGFYYQNRVSIDCNWVLHVWIHEFGHCLGYSHNSSLCYGSVPDNIVPKVYRYMIKKLMLPYTINPFKHYNNYNPGSSDADNPDIEL